MSTLELSNAAESAAQILARYRIGSVPYLNARPLIEGMADQFTFCVPSQVAERFTAGEFDAALLPIYEAVSRERATIADDMAIASRGEVFSVFLAHREPLANLKSIALDPASHTSNQLLRCLFAEFYKQDLEYIAAPRDETQARLLIGDEALRFREAHWRDGWKFLDLGAEWMRWTGLPFVFACWVLREDVRQPDLLARALREMKARGLAARSRIAMEYENSAFVERYLTHFIRFDLREEEKRAITLFTNLLHKHGFVKTPSHSKIRYV